MSSPLTPSDRAQSIEPTLIRALRSKMGPSTIDFGLGQTDLAVSEAVRRRMHGRWSESLTAPYTPNAGSLEARRAVADHVGAQVDEIMLTCGVQEALAVSILGLCNPGDEVLVPDPGFPAYANLVRAAGARPVAYPLTAPTPQSPGWALDPTAVADRISDDTVLLVLNTPSNPTGSVHSAESLRDTLEIAADRGIGWISDEIYEDYVYDTAFVSAADVSSGPGIVLSGLSKSHHMMGWRLGWMVAPAETVEALTPLHQHLVTCAPRPAQEAAIAALDDHDEAMNSTLSVFEKRRRQVVDGVDDLSLGSPASVDGAFYLFLDVRPWLDAFETTVDMARALLDEQDVMVIPGEGFGAGGLGHLRVAFTIGGDELSEGIRRIHAFLTCH